MTQESRFSRMEPELRKANLVQATLTCLKRDGFQGASIRKISAEAGVSVGLISHHYSGKDELVAEAYRTITAQVMSLLRETMAKAPRNLGNACRRCFVARFLRSCSTRNCWMPGWYSGAR